MVVRLSSFPRPTENIHLQLQGTRVFVDEFDVGKGTLYISESKFTWIGDNDYGFEIDYPNISLHAICRDKNAFPFDHLFLMLDIKLEIQQTNMDQDDDTEKEYSEIRLIPEDKGLLDAMFHALSVCQTLHPDPEQNFSDEDVSDQYEDYEDASNGMSHENGINTQMSSLCIAGNNAFVGADNTAADNTAAAAGMVEDRVADIPGTLEGRVEDRAADRVAGMEEGTAAAAEGAYRTLGTGVVDMAADRAVDTVVGNNLRSSSHTSSYFSRMAPADTRTDTGLFDDAES